MEQLERLLASPHALIVPVSFSSLSKAEHRARIVDALKETAGFSSKGVICELTGIDGAPIATLFPVVAMIRPYTLFVIGHLAEPGQRRGPALTEVGVRGVSLECPPNMGEAEFFGWARAAIGQARRAAKAVLLYGAPSAAAAQAAMSVGVTHASLA